MKKILRNSLLALAVLTLGSCATTTQNCYDDSKFTTIFNGENFDGWYLKILSGNDSLAKEVYAIEDGAVHVFNDKFPDQYGFGSEWDTYGLFYTEKEYSRYILRFDYKWGKKTANNYNAFQYDAGCYYHVIDDKIWPVGIEYQIRYNDSTDKNHTGDYWIGEATPMEWYTDGDDHFLSEKDGGTKAEYRPGEHLALKGFKANGLNDKWNECEIIVMADEYSIHKLNGEVVNMATNLGIKAGKIGFQSETGEIFYRNIRILEFDETIYMEKFL